MANISDLFSWIGGGKTAELPELYPMPVRQGDFVSIDVQNIFTRILVDVFERTQGIPEEKQKLLWDSCVKAESSDGLISLVSKAMVDKSDLYLVYAKEVDVVRKATHSEESQIRADYAKKAESSVGVYISFKNYKVTDMIKFYSSLEYCSVGSLYKLMNLSKAVQIKISQLRASTGVSDKADALKQAEAIAAALKDGKAIAIDANDIIEMLVPDLTSTETSMDFIAQKQSLYLGLPSSYFKGSSNSSKLSDTGKADSKSVERGLRPYFYSIVKPVADYLFGVKTSFKSEDYDLLTTANETLKTFEVTSDEYVSGDNKRKVLNKLFGFPENTKGDEPEKIVTPPALPPGQTPPDPQPPAV